MASCIQGNGKASFQVQAFSLQKSMQNLSPPSFLWTRTMALLHADLLGLITPHQACDLSASSPPQEDLKGYFLASPLKVSDLSL